MSSWAIYKQSIKIILKDYKTLMVTTLFPIVLTMIFVTVFSALETPKQISIAIKLEGEESPVMIAYKQFLDAIDQEGVKIELLGNVDAMPKDRVKVSIEDEKQEISVEQSDGDLQKRQIVKQLSQQFIDEMLMNDLESSIQLETITHTIVKPLQTNTTQTIVITMIVFMAMLSGEYGMRLIHEMQTTRGKRISIAPISKKACYIGHGAAAFTVSFIQLMMLVILFDGMFKVPFLRNFVGMVVVIIGLGMLCTALGICLAAWIQEEGTADNILSMIVTLLCILSGGLMPNMAELPFSYLSPVKYVLEAIGELLTDGITDSTLIFLGGMLIGSILLILLASIRLRKEVE